jgi:hypothetical protein
LLLISYGTVQFFGFEPFPFQKSGQNSVFGTFGNPDFMSAFMGILAILSLTIGVFQKSRVPIRILHITIAVASLLMIRLTHSVQGFYCFFIALVVIVILYFAKLKRRLISLIILGFGSILGITLALGIFNLGPVAKIISESSLTARQYYWNAAFRIIAEKPFFGVGLDNFGDWNRRFRTAEEVRNNPMFLSDVSHSVPLDIAVGGGIPLLFLYMCILGLTVLSIIRVFRRSEHLDPRFLGISGGWIAYQAQSIISINQLGVAVWGWILSGVIIGYDLQANKATEDKLHILRKDRRYTVFANVKFHHKVVLGIVLGVGMSLPYYFSAVKFYDALSTGNPRVIQESAYLKPYERMRFLYVARALSQNNYPKESIRVLRDASKIYPDSFDLWSLWAEIPSATPSEVIHAKEEMKRLDPYNPDIK